MQSISRAFEVLEMLAEHGPLSLSRLAAAAGLPLSTFIGWSARCPRSATCVRDAKEYSLAPRLIHLGERSSRMLSRWAIPHLTGLVDELGETANLAMLDGDRIVYVAQVPSRHSMRMFTEVGRRVLPHCTAVGKALLARLPDAEVDAHGRSNRPPGAHRAHDHHPEPPWPPRSARSRTDGYAVDDGEQEIGVRCVAVALDGSTAAARPVGLGPAPRMTEDLVNRAVPALTAGRRRLRRRPRGGLPVPRAAPPRRAMPGRRDPRR